jgi:hypothetical protein
MKNLFHKHKNQKMKIKVKPKSRFIGAKLTILFILTFCSAVYGQDITNTLGSEGVFTIKDTSMTFLSLNQLDGLINITNNVNIAPTTGSETGVIYKGNDRFIHNYESNGTPGQNTFIGLNSGNFSLTGSSNTGIGYSSLYSNTTGNSNTAIGYFSLYSNTTGSWNTAIGNESFQSNSTGNENTAIGYSSLRSNTTGENNTAIGNSSLYTNTTGNLNTAIGYSSLRLNSEGFQNTAIGYFSLYSNTLGYFNTAIGNSSLRSNTTGYYNTAIGLSSLYSNTIGYHNIAIGISSLSSNTTGNYNTAVGIFALGENSTGEYNTAIGYQAGEFITTGSNVTCLGFNSSPSSGSITNQITLGNNQITSLRCNVQSISSLSDRRDKKNINDLSLGLDFIMKLKPRQFNWDRREWYEDGNADGSMMEETPTAGFIAQELDNAQMSEDSDWLKLVLKDNPEKLEATPGNLLPVIVKAIQDLKSENDELKRQIEMLKFENSNRVELVNLDKKK